MKLSLLARFPPAVYRHTVRYYCYCMDGKPLSQWAGNAVELKFAIASTVAEGDYEFQVSRIKMGTAQLLDKCSETEGRFTVTVKRRLVGDIDGNGLVNVSDVSMLVNMILELKAKDYDVADLDHNGVINVSDVSLLVNQILYK